MKSRRVSKALVCASFISLVAVSGAASAQHITRIVAFGDSYADTGNFFRLVGVNPTSTQIYNTGRFSGGSNYVDTLTNLLQVQQYNFAIGGARTNNTNQTAGAPGLTFEVQQFLAGGGGAAGFPTVNTTLTQNDLVAVSIGGNDARAYQLGGGSLAGAPAAATTAVTSFQQNFDLVVARGTPTISFLAGDTGQLPEITGNPTGAAIRTSFSTTFNTGVQTVLAGYASRGSIVHYLDGAALLNQIKSNLGAYGLQGITCPALPNTTCIADNSAPYLFYVDNLHLTSVGFSILAKYVAKQVAAPLTLQAPSDLGFETAQQWGRTLNSRSDLYGRGGSSSGDGFRVYALADGYERNAATTATNNAYDARGLGGTLGAEYAAGGALVGIAGNYTRPKLSFNDQSARIRAHSWQIGAYGSVEMGGFFGQGYLGYGRDRNSITRTGVVSDMTANPHGNHTVAGAKGGYLFGLGAFEAGPTVAVDYTRAKVNAYTEAGDAALTLNVGRQSLKAVTGQAGIEVRGELAGLHPFVDAVAERDFTGDDRAIIFSETSAPTIVNTWHVNRRQETYGRLSGGASANITGNVSVDAYVSTTLGRDHGQTTSGNLGLKARF